MNRRRALLLSVAALGACATPNGSADPYEQAVLYPGFESRRFEILPGDGAAPHIMTERVDAPWFKDSIESEAWYLRVVDGPLKGRVFVFSVYEKGIEASLEYARQPRDLNLPNLPFVVHVPASQYGGPVKGILHGIKRAGPAFSGARDTEALGMAYLFERPPGTVALDGAR